MPNPKNTIPWDTNFQIFESGSSKDDNGCEIKGKQFSLAKKKRREKRLHEQENANGN